MLFDKDWFVIAIFRGFLRKSNKIVSRFQPHQKIFYAPDESFPYNAKIMKDE